MKKQSLKLNTLQIDSFITASPKELTTIKGGATNNVSCAAGNMSATYINTITDPTTSVLNTPPISIVFTGRG